MVILAVCVGATAGCSSGARDKPSMSKVVGTVKLDGQPLAAGVIVADPEDRQGLPAQGTIKDGRFEFEVTPGPKVIRISAVRQTGAKDEYGAVISEEAIPAKYNSSTTLKETVQPAGNSEWAFEIESK